MAVVFVCVLAAMVAGGPDLRGEDFYKPWMQKPTSLDWMGSSLMIMAATTLLLALQFSQEYSWKTPRVLVFLV